MAVKLKIGKSAPRTQTFGMRLLRATLILSLGGLLLFAAIFGFYYYKYQRIVDDRLQAGPLFANVAQIYAAPREIRTGQKLSVGYIAQNLRQAGYNSNPQLGTFSVRGDEIFVKPGPLSYHSTEGATINAAGGEVQRITAENGAALRAFKLEPLLITGLSEDKNRTKRRLVTYNQIPKNMVNAVVAIEDRTFFENSGVNYVSMAGWGWHDLVGDRKYRGGGSTLTMQLAKNLFLSPTRTIKYKLIQIMVAFQLEARFTKQQIFEDYANEINLGQRGSYAVNGFGEAAQAFFGKPLGQLDLAECATLAAMIQSPNRLNPYRHADRVMERRNVVLDSMVETGAITSTEAERAKAEPLRLAPPNVDASEAPYFIDLVHEQIVQRLGDQDAAHDSLRIYTSLDPELQRIASEAVTAGMAHVDDLVRKLHRDKNKPITYPQVALVALDPHTGQILALVGGRNYGISQLNHATASRPTGSIFKPLVYAAAYNTSVAGQQLSSGTFTAVTPLNDDPQNFGTPDKPYIPGNFEHGEYPGMVIAATALAHSLNIATIALAQQVGYENVASLARSAGISAARATPSVAIGTYSATPIDMAGVYTVFANNGVHLQPWMLDSVRNPSGDIVADFAPEARQVLDPKVAYLTQSLLEGVLNYGTAQGAVRGHGFTAPAAGKTGTEHDAWFAGYTSNLLCLIWIGNDDYTDISNNLTHSLQGADTAAPIWTSFMSEAIRLPQYSDTKPFTPPEGISIVRIDRSTNTVADASCPNDYIYAFLDGTVPQTTCSMGESPQALAQQLSGADATDNATNPDGTPAEPKKRNFIQKMFGIGKDNQQQQPPPPQQ